MQINITKSGIIRVVITAAIVVVLFAAGYLIGYDRGVASMENPKGDGEHFYSEIQDASGINDHIFKYHKILYHSTTECPSIRGGVDMDSYKYTESIGGGDAPYYFCPTCMDADLIKLCEHNISLFE